MYDPDVPSTSYQTNNGQYIPECEPVTPPESPEPSETYQSQLEHQYNQNTQLYSYIDLLYELPKATIEEVESDDAESDGAESDETESSVDKEVNMDDYQLFYDEDYFSLSDDDRSSLNEIKDLVTKHLNGDTDARRKINNLLFPCLQEEESNHEMDIEEGSSVI